MSRNRPGSGESPVRGGAHGPIGPEVDLPGFEWTTPERPSDTLYVAVATTVIREGDPTRFVDDLSVERTGYCIHYTVGQRLR